MANEVSLAVVARGLDAMLDGVMTAQARVLAHLVAACASAGEDAEGVIATLEAVAATTVLDECWVSDEQGTVYITTVRDEAGAPTAFRFNPDPAGAAAGIRVLPAAVVPRR